MSPTNKRFNVTTQLKCYIMINKLYMQFKYIEVQHILTLYTNNIGNDAFHLIHIYSRSFKRFTLELS